MTKPPGLDAILSAPILLYEPVNNDRRLIHELLRKLGVENVIQVSSPEELKGALNEGPFSCALVNWRHSRREKRCLITGLRRHSDESLRTMPIVACAIQPGAADLFQMRDAGATAVLVKPIAPATLKKTIARSLKDNRNFIFADAYAGPDRRIREMRTTFPNRRDAGLSQDEIDNLMND